MSTALVTAQRWLLHAITDRRAPRSLEALGGARVPARAGLEIYRHAYRSRLVDSLVDDFPALQAVLGTKEFAALADAVTAAMPPTEATLNRFGQRLVTFLRQHPEVTPHGRLALDLARLEWALIEAIHAPVAQAIPPTAFTTIPDTAWPQVRLRASPSLRLIASRWPIDAWYGQHQRGAAMTVPAEQSEVVAVIRHADGLRRQRFSPGGGRLVRRLVRGLPVGEAVAGSGLASEALSVVLRTAVAFGCFCAVDRP